MVKLWQRATSIWLPSLCNSEYNRLTDGEDAEAALCKSPPALQRTPLEISALKFNSFLSLE